MSIDEVLDQITSEWPERNIFDSQKALYYNNVPIVVYILKDHAESGWSDRELNLYLRLRRITDRKVLTDIELAEESFENILCDEDLPLPVVGRQVVLEVRPPRRELRIDDFLLGESNWDDEYKEREELFREIKDLISQKKPIVYRKKKDMNGMSRLFEKKQLSLEEAITRNNRYTFDLEHERRRFFIRVDLVFESKAGEVYAELKTIARVKSSRQEKRKIQLQCMDKVLRYLDIPSPMMYVLTELPTREDILTLSDLGREAMIVSFVSKDSVHNWYRREKRRLHESVDTMNEFMFVEQLYHSLL